MTDSNRLTPKFNCGDIVYIPMKVKIYNVRIGKHCISYGIRDRESGKIVHIKEQSVFATKEQAESAIREIWAI